MLDCVRQVPNSVRDDHRLVCRLVSVTDDGARDPIQRTCGPHCRLHVYQLYQTTAAAAADRIECVLPSDPPDRL